MNKILTVLILSLTFVFAANVGDTLDAFSTFADDGKIWSSDSLTSDYLVVYFYPAAMTFGCTKQACSYRDNKQEFEELNASIVGVSGDEVEALKVFKDAHNLNFTLLSDSKGKIADHFGVPTSEGGKISKKIDGEDVVLRRGVTTKRWTFILDKTGKVIYKDDGVNPLNDAKKVLEQLQK